MQKNFKTIFLFVLASASAVIWYSVFHFEGRQNLLITFFDVGQGDAALIEIGGNQILIDGGPSDAILAKLGEEMPFWDRSIDLLILSHPHADHLAGLLEVLKRYEVGMVLESGIEHSIPEYQEWRRTIEEKKIPRVTAARGQIIDAGNSVMLRVLAPQESFERKTRKNVHDGNVVVRLDHGENSLLFTGDAEKMIEFQLTHDYPDLIGTDILKVGHHGSKTSSSREFLELVSPDVAVIQSGKNNRYGHPAQEVLDRLAAVGAKILRNDLEGDITIRSDGVAFQIR